MNDKASLETLVRLRFQLGPNFSFVIYVLHACTLNAYIEIFGILIAIYELALLHVNNN